MRWPSPWVRRALIAAAVVAVAVPLVRSAERAPTAAPTASPPASLSPLPSVSVRMTIAPIAHPVVDNAAMRRLVALTNNERVRHGLPALRWWSAANVVVKRHTDEMVDDGRLYHNPRLEAELGRLDVSEIGENVGVGPTIDRIQQAFMRSREHRENVLHPRYRLVSLWVVRDVRGLLWVTVNFGAP